MKKLIKKEERVVKQTVIHKEYEYVCDDCKKVYKTDVLKKCRYCKADICKRCRIERFDYDNDSYTTHTYTCNDCNKLWEKCSKECDILDDKIIKLQDACVIQCQLNRKNKK